MHRAMLATILVAGLLVWPGQSATAASVVHEAENAVIASPTRCPAIGRVRAVTCR